MTRIPFYFYKSHGKYKILTFKRDICLFLKLKKSIVILFS